MSNFKNSAAPLLLRFSDGGDQESPTIVDPFGDGESIRSSSLQTMETLKGKRCLSCLEGEWLLMYDEGTKECFMTSLSSSHSTTISLPPLPAKVPVEKLGKCALSSPIPPNCNIMITTTVESDDDEEDYENTTYMLYCWPGDEDWSVLDDDNDGTYRTLDYLYGIFGSQGTMYMSTYMYKRAFIAIDASSSYEATVERRGIPSPDKMRWGCSKECWVESDGDILLLHFYTHGFQNSEIIDMDIHRLDTSIYTWNKVDSIGDRTIFVGDNCVALSSAATRRSGLRSGCVYVLHKYCSDGIRLYTIQLDDRTMSCKLLRDGSSSPRNNTYYWVVPSSFFGKESSEENLKTTTTLASKTINKTNKLAFEEDDVVAPWASLPTDFVEGLVSRISFIDYLNIREVCKGWSWISKPIEYTERYPIYPLLLSISSSGGSFKLFDPVVEKEYTVKKNDSLVKSSKDYFEMLLFAKHGWVLVLQGEKHMYAVNPFTGERLDLPEMPQYGNQFDGVAFSSAPNSPDCTVCCIHKLRTSFRTDRLYVMVWRVGDGHWTEEEIGDETQFRTTYSNPVFYHGEFYCLGTRGNIGVFNQDNMTWRVLDKPGPILDGDSMPSEHHCYLLEYKDDLIAIFRPHNKGPIDMYRLDSSRMVWNVVERFDDQVIFVDNWNAIMVPTPRDACGNNRIYMPKLGGSNEAGEADNKGTFYDFKSRKYHPDYYGLTERMNSIWVEPNSHNWEILISE